jgi:hypothetical protein
VYNPVEASVRVRIPYVGGVNARDTREANLTLDITLQEIIRLLTLFRFQTSLLLGGLH